MTEEKERDMNAYLDGIFEFAPRVEPERIGRERAEAALRRAFNLDEGQDLRYCSVRWCVGALTERRADDGTPLVPRARQMLQVFTLLMGELGPMGITVEKALSMQTVEEVCAYIAGLEDRSGRPA